MPVTAGCEKADQATFPAPGPVGRALASEPGNYIGQGSSTSGC